MQVINYGPQLRYRVPVYGGAADIVKGALLKRGATPATDQGAAIVAGGSSAIPDVIGILKEMLDYSEDGETLANGTAFVTKEVEPVFPGRVLKVQYDLTSLIDATQAVSTTTITLTSLEDNIDAAFLYVVSGTGAGQTNFLTAAASGSATLKAAFGTDLDTTSKLIKILPRFHDIISFNTAGTKLASQAAAGAVKGCILDSFIERNNRIEQLDPTKHAALSNLDDLASLRFFAHVIIRDTIAYTVD